MAEENKDAIERLTNEESSGRIEFPDGTILEGDEIVKVGTRAIIVNGEFKGLTTVQE